MKTNPLQETLILLLESLYSTTPQDQNLDLTNLTKVFLSSTGVIYAYFNYDKEAPAIISCTAPGNIPTLEQLKNALRENIKDVTVQLMTIHRRERYQEEKGPSTSMYVLHQITCWGLYSGYDVKLCINKDHTFTVCGMNDTGPVWQHTAKLNIPTTEASNNVD